MRNRTKILVASLAVGMAVTLTGCGGCFGCRGCNSNTASNTLTRSNWFTGTSYNGIQPSFVEDGNNFSAEIMTYDVTYDNTNAKNANVAVDYRDGHFTTVFYAKKYDWTDPAIPAGYADNKVKEEIVYVYKTELTISVKYAMKTGSKEESGWFNDRVTTESYFRAAGKNLKPVYSRQYIKSTSPANYQPKTLKDAYKEIEVSYSNFYNYECTKVLSKTTENGATEDKEYEKLNKLSSPFFDNSSLYIVARSFLKSSSTVSQSVSLFSPAAGGVDTYAVIGTDSELSKEERADFTSKLSASGLYKSAEGEEDKGVETTAVNLSFAGGNLHGTSQTVWYASVTDADHNVPRATMLKVSVPISFSLGTLNYTLKEINSTLWNG